MLNLHQLFFKSTEPACFLNKLDIAAEDRQTLAKARTDIRKCLRLGIPRLMREWIDKGEKVTPAFFTQGSWAYGTLNDPAHMPPQEIDLDDGVYLVMSLLSGQPPSIACNVYFRIVETLLEELAQKKGWKLADPAKETCVRVIINSHSHVDVPLYAIPDSEFQKLKDESKKRGYESLTAALSSTDTNQWLWLQSDKVWLALRGGNWKQSDPRKVYDWFMSQVNIYGPQYVRVCRYLKAWRDQQWEAGGPSSILLMVCASKSFKKCGGRDDLAIMEVANILSTQLAQDVFNPNIDPQEQLNALTAKERHEAVARSNTLYATLDKAVVDSQDPTIAINLLTGHFGSRFPSKPEWVKELVPAQVVRSTPKRVVPAPAIQRVKAG